MAFIIKSVFIFSIALLAACALSPQTVTLSPVLTLSPGEAPGRLNTLAITVNDSRTDNVIGARGGVYRETSLITSSPDMPRSLQLRISEAFRDLGYNVVSNNADADLSINIAELKYTASGSNTITAVETTAAIRVKCRNDNYRMNNDYRITDKQEVLKAPSVSRNSEIINATLSSALQRMFDDEKLLDCINR
ncbi:MAG: YajG family lipoprotein [Gammaproteobacteria bacterium]